MHGFEPLLAILPEALGQHPAPDRLDAQTDPMPPKANGKLRPLGIAMWEA
jgi:hypothetical protein